MNMTCELNVEDLAAVHGGGPIPYPVGPAGDVGWVDTSVKPSELAGAGAFIAGIASGGAAAVLGIAAIVLNHFGD